MSLLHHGRSMTMKRNTSLLFSSKKVRLLESNHIKGLACIHVNSSSLLQSNRHISVRNFSDLGEAWQSFKNFPKGVKQLYNDCLTYKNIEAASKSKRNAWTRLKSIHELNTSPKRWSKLPFLQNDERPGYIPRRQNELQRRLKYDILSCAPVVTLYLSIPVIGNVFVFLGIAFPRLLLSRQFYSKDQVRIFSDIEHKQKKIHYKALAELAWGKYGSKASIDSMTTMNKEDVAGPLFIDARPLLQMFESASDTSFQSLETLSRDHLMQLSLATGLLRFGDSINASVVKLIPSQLLRYILKNVAKEIITDDALLLKEFSDLNELSSFSDDEVISACSLRGLPIDNTTSIDQMRTCLSNYLMMMNHLDSVNDKEGAHQMISVESLELFVLHIQAIRYQLAN